MPTTDTNVPQVIVNKLTKAQYEAATKSPTEFYVVSDEQIGTSDIADGAVTAAKASFTTYSTSEQVVGTWTDGRPIYRQAFNGTNISTGSSTKYVDLIASDVDTIINYGGSMHSSLVKIAIPSGGFSDNSAIRLAEVNGTLRLQADLGTAWTEYTVWAEYTKISDL